MKVHVAAGASEEEASAIAAAVAEHVGETVEVFLGDGDEPAVVHDVDASPATDGQTSGSAGATDDGEEDLGPTDRERRLRDEIADIHRGGPEKYRDRLSEQGKLFVRDRLDLWFGDDGVHFEDGTFANFDGWHEDSPEIDEADPDTRLPADGLLTGAVTFEGRDLFFMANDFTVKAGSMAEKGVEKFLRMQQRALKTGKPVLYLMDSSGGRIDQQGVSSQTARESGSTTTTTRCCRGGCPRSASSTAPASPVRPTPRFSQTSR